MLALLNERAKASVPANGVITLASTNQKVNQINENHLKGLSSSLFTYEASISGDFDQSYFPVEQSLRLKTGAQVMLLKNDKQKRWVNGTIGYIHSLSKIKSIQYTKRPGIKYVILTILKPIL